MEYDIDKIILSKRWKIMGRWFNVSVSWGKRNILLLEKLQWISATLLWLNYRLGSFYYVLIPWKCFLLKNWEVCLALEVNYEYQCSFMLLYACFYTSNSMILNLFLCDFQLFKMCSSLHKLSDSFFNSLSDLWKNFVYLGNTSSSKWICSGHKWSCYSIFCSLRLWIYR